MIGQKDSIVKEMKEVEEVLMMYKEAFPDNPAFATSSKKKDK